MNSRVRIAYPGAFYHIINRGVLKGDIFYRNKDKVHFENLLGEMCLKYDVQVHAYCLMDNHFHLTICTQKPNISKAIHFLESAYVNRMNSELEREGPFFQGRFLAILVDSEEYLRHLTRYIHLNPVKARMVDWAQLYRWSSYSAYIGLVDPQPWLEISTVLSDFNHDMGRYQQFVEEHQVVVLDHFFAKKDVPLILGTEKFRVKLEQMAKTFPELQKKKITEVLKARYSFEQILSVVADVFDIPRDQVLKVEYNKHNVPRLVFTHLCKELSGLRNREISDYLGVLSESGTSTAVKRLSKLMDVKPEVRDILDICRVKLLAQEPCNMQGLLEPDQPKPRALDD